VHNTSSHLTYVNVQPDGYRKLVAIQQKRPCAAKSTACPEISKEELRSVVGGMLATRTGRCEVIASMNRNTELKGTPIPIGG
jgi:hypothetical protein